MKIWRFITENRYGEALYLTVISIVLSVILGALLSLIAGTFWHMTQVIFWFFCAPGIVSALLLVLTNIESDLSWRFGYGLYYGSVFLIAVFKEIGDKSLPYIAGISLTIAVCYSIYLKKFSERNMNLIKTLDRVGQEFFVKYYYDFRDKSYDECFECFTENYTNDDKKTKIAHARKIFRVNKQSEALRIIVNSLRVDEDTRKMAEKILFNEII